MCAGIPSVRTDAAPASPTAPARRASVSDRLVRGGLIALAYLALALWWLWPLPRHLGDHFIYPETASPFIAADLHLITWALAWDTHALLTAPLSLFDANIFHPAPSSLAFSEHFLGYLPLFAPTYLLSGNAVLASNLVILATFPLCALAAYALARRFVAPAAAFVAGALFAFHAQRYVNLYHLHQLGTFYLPLALLFTERWLERARRRDAVALAVAVALQLLSSFYLAYAIVLLYAAYLPFALWRWRGVLDRRRMVGLATALVAAGVPMLLTSIPYVRLQQLGLVPSGNSPMVELALESFITMSRVRTYLTEGGVGVVGYVLATLGLVVGWRGGAYPRVLGVLLCVLGIFLAAGPAVILGGVEYWSPYALLFRWLPGFSAVRLPFRFLVIAQLGFVLLAALGAEQMLRRLPRGVGWPAALATIALGLALAPARVPHTLHPQTSPDRLPLAYRWLVEHGEGGVLLELPVAEPAVAGHRMLFSTYHWLPILDGYSAYPPLTRRYLIPMAKGLPREHALQQLVDAVDVRWVLVHLDQLSEAERKEWQDDFYPGLELVERWEDDALYEVDLPVSTDRRALLQRTRETLGGLPLAPIGAACPGRITAELVEKQRPLRPGERTLLRVDVENRSDEAWPGLALYPRHLVQLRTTFARNGRRTGIPRTQPLWSDLPSQHAVEAFVEIVAPHGAGKFSLDVELVQDGESLVRCGFASTRIEVEVGAGPADPPEPEPVA